MVNHNKNNTAAICSEASKQFFPKISHILESDIPFFEKVDESQFRNFMEQRKTEIPKFIIEAIKK